MRLVFYLFVLLSLCSNLSQNMINVINFHRSRSKMKPLKLIANLVATANDQAMHMCENMNLSHQNPLGDLKNRSIRNGFLGNVVGENIAKHRSENVEEVVDAWMNSTQHKNPIFGKFEYTGIGTCLDKKGNRYWAQVFGTEENQEEAINYKN